MRIGVFGGTYDPVHLGHIWTARAVRDELGLDRLFMVVTCNPPHKHDEHRTDGNIRLDMLKAALADERGIEASDVELMRGGESYTVDTLVRFKRAYPDAELVFIVGGDMLENFPHWRDPSGILSLAVLAAVARPGTDEDMERLAARVTGSFGGEVRLCRYTGPDISSTDVRRRVENALPIDTLVPLRTERYIYENALYMPQMIVDTYQRLLQTLDGKRLVHTMMTVREAVALACRYGADPKKARLAALLHDCIRLPSKDILRYARERCYNLTPDEIENPALIHSRLGAVVAMEDYCVTDADVLKAIECHTLGRVGMSKLDKILYLADKIEPTRNFDGVDEIREAAYRSLNEGIILMMKRSVEHNASRGNAVHPLTLQAMESIQNEHTEE